MRIEPRPAFKRPLNYIRICAWVMLFACPALATDFSVGEATIYKLPPKPRPASLISLDAADYALVAEKSTQTLRVYDNAFRLLQTVPVSTGKVKGDKQMRGDLKTPEGVYFFINVMDIRELEDKFGFLALTTNYPNMHDRYLRKTGSGIWLHAVDFRQDEIRSFDTKGCIAVANEHVLEIARFVTLEETPLVIVDRIVHEAPDRLEAEKQAILNLLTQWKDAREKQDVDAYLKLYADQARIMGVDRGQMEQNIRQAAREYDYVRIHLEKVNIVNHAPHYAVVNCLQDLHTNRFRNQGVKRFYLVRQDDSWRILREEWREPTRKQPREAAGNMAPLVMRRDPDTGVHREGWFLSRAPERYAIQLVGVSSRERLIEYIRANNLSRNVGFFRTCHEGQDWFVVLYGNYPDGPAARAARDKLPAHLAKAAPWVRSFQSIQESILAPYR